MSDPATLIELPVYETSLIGRNRARTALIEHVRTPGQRLITLIGASGAGKTRLALQVAQELAPEYARVTFVALAPVRLPVLVLPTILHTLGLREGGQLAAVDLLARSFENQRLFLLLDNFEQVIEAGAYLSTILERLPLLTILVTSQEPLNVPEETVFEVPPLAVPQVQDLSVDEALVYSSVQLFVERIKVVQPQFIFSQAHVEPIVDICRRVQGLPLAIELIAAHSQVLEPQDLAMLVRNHLAMGRNLSLTRAVSRQEILWPVLDWSYRMLDPQVQKLFDRIGVFWGGCTVDSAEAICNHLGDIELSIEDALQVLVDKHIVQVETLVDQATRYIMLDAVQEYASEHLKKSRDAEVLHFYHAEYYLAFTEQAQAQLHGAEQGRWFRQLNEDIHNIRKAINWLLEAQQYELALRLSSNIYIFWQMQGFLSEGQAWLKQGLVYADQVEPAVVVAAQHAYGVLLWSQGAFEEAQVVFERNLPLQKQVHDTEGVAKTLNNLANLHYNYGRYQAALDLYLECLELWKHLDDTSRIAAVMGNIGVVYSIMGDQEPAWHYKQESLRLRRKIGNQVELVFSLSNLGRDAIRDGNYEQALAYLEEGYELLKQVDERFLMASIMSNFGLVYWEIGDQDQARKWATEGVYLRHAIGDQRSMPNALIILALVYAVLYPTLMARMMGFVLHYLEQKQTPFQPYTKQLFDRAMAEIEAQIGTEALAAAQTQGTTDSIDALLKAFEAVSLDGSEEE